MSVLPRGYESFRPPARPCCYDFPCKADCFNHGACTRPSGRYARTVWYPGECTPAGGSSGRIGGAGHGQGQGRTGAGQGEHPPPGQTEHTPISLLDAAQGFVLYG
ncbi:Uncharacterized protein OBRU01_06559 [Operophtera brumata]|uniref:Uncharacterized protein n=1 Tax=Operophtera brumata TaxID=104452 RepID=A0A0L7LL46_OPEBR|nr:Uncharacterized protein OBRU01_06559 [Operophtera brumata]